MRKEDLEKARTYIPQLFAYGINAECHKVDTDASGFTYKAGIPSIYSSLQGQKVCYADINGLVRSTTQSKWFNQLGGYYTFDPDVSEKIGGYPLGAVLSYKDPETGYIREVRSLIADNTYNFVEDPSFINDTYWEYVDNVPPSGFRPRIFPKYEQIVDGCLVIDELLEIKYPCMMMLATGCDSTDATRDGQDYYLYATVKSEGQDLFYTAGLVCYLPDIPDVLSEGVLVEYKDCENANAVAKQMQKSFNAFSSPSPIQLYLLPGDVLKLSGNRDLEIMKSEEFTYWMFPLGA